MKAKNLLFSTGLALSAVVGVSSAAQAASFTTNVTVDNSPTGDVLFNSITQNGRNATFGINLFSVTSVDILENTVVGDPVSPDGGAGADAGDTASQPSLNLNNLGTGAAGDTKAAQYLGTNNLNNIIDTEDRGSFKMNVFFGREINRSDDGFDNLFFWERGLNSSIRVRALDALGNLIGSEFILSTWDDTEIDINTLEIDGNQDLGSYGVSFADLGLDALGITSFAGIQLSADGQPFNGPDFKLVAGEITVGGPTVPEPTTILGLGSIAALALISRRQTKKSSV
jgi:hypothetical protein